MKKLSVHTKEQNMKISKQHLRRVIREEYSRLLKEGRIKDATEIQNKVFDLWDDHLQDPKFKNVKAHAGGMTIKELNQYEDKDSGQIVSDYLVSVKRSSDEYDKTGGGVFVVFPNGRVIMNSDEKDIAKHAPSRAWVQKLQKNGIKSISADKDYKAFNKNRKNESVQISKKQLRQIIREEYTRLKIRRMLNENDSMKEKYQREDGGFADEYQGGDENFNSKFKAVAYERYQALRRNYDPDEAKIYVGVDRDGVIEFCIDSRMKKCIGTVSKNQKPHYAQTMKAIKKGDKKALLKIAKQAADDPIITEKEIVIRG